MGSNDQNRTGAASKTHPQRLRVGFVPLCDCAPLVMAGEAGLFEKYGLKVELIREVGWATIRDKLACGQLDAAHALAAMPFAARLGIGSVLCPSLTGVVLNLQGNAISLSLRYWKEGVRDAKTFGAHIRQRKLIEPLVFGIVSLVSTHKYLMQKWLAEAGLVHQVDYQFAVVPPPQLPDLIRAGHLAGFCVGEPWNSVAIQRGLAWSPATSVDLAPNHPEKVLFVTERFAQERHEEHLRLIAAVMDACVLCAQTDMHEHISEVLSKRHYVGASTQLIRRSFSGKFVAGPGSGRDPRPFTVYQSGDSNAPTYERGAWVLKHLLTGADPLTPPQGDALIEQVFREDLYRAALRLRAPSSLNRNHETKTELETEHATSN